MADQDPNAGASGSSAATSFAHDLRAIREERGVSLDDVQQETRMPADILGRFESGELIGDQHYNEVYLRNLLKSYAQALGISAHEVLSAYDQAKAGAYDGALRRRFLASGADQESEQKPAPQPKQATADESATDDASTKQTKPADDDGSSPKPPRSAGSGGKAPAVAALSSPRKEKEPRAEQTEPSRSSPTRPKRRVASASAASKPIEKSWGIITGTVIGALVVIALILWFLFRDPGPEPELAAVPAPADTAEAAPADTAEATPEPAEPSSAPRFQTPIRLNVAATDAPLESFRVRVDEDVRRPYWLNPGVDTTFVGQQEVVVWGELGVDGTGGGSYDGATLRLQGLEWTPSNGRIVRINQQTGQALLDSLNRVSNAAPTG